MSLLLSATLPGASIYLVPNSNAAKGLRTMLQDALAHAISQTNKGNTALRRSSIEVTFASRTSKPTFKGSRAASQSMALKLDATTRATSTLKPTDGLRVAIKISDKDPTTTAVPDIASVLVALQPMLSSEMAVPSSRSKFIIDDVQSIKRVGTCNDGICQVCGTCVWFNHGLSLAYGLFWSGCRSWAMVLILLGCPYVSPDSCMAPHAYLHACKGADRCMFSSIKYSVALLQVNERVAVDNTNNCTIDCSFPYLSCPPFNTSSQSAGVCSGKGVCFTSVGACSCALGYSGADCSRCAVGYTRAGNFCVTSRAPPPVVNPCASGLACILNASTPSNATEGVYISPLQGQMGVTIGVLLGTMALTAAAAVFVYKWQLRRRLQRYKVFVKGLANVCSE